MNLHGSIAFNLAHICIPIIAGISTGNFICKKNRGEFLTKKEIVLLMSMKAIANIAFSYYFESANKISNIVELQKRLQQTAP